MKLPMQLDEVDAPFSGRFARDQKIEDPAYSWGS
jgi:hypothetical protein